MTGDGTADGTDRTHIIRRAPVGGLPQIPDDVRTGLIAPVPSEAPTSLVPPPPVHDAPTGLITPARLDFTASLPSPVVPSAAVAVSILSGWATGVIATDLIASWWRTDTAFCLAVAFLTSMLGVATPAGVILLMLRRRLGSLLLVAGSAASLLMFAGLFVADATVPWIVYAIPALPLVGAALAVVPPTRRWWRPGHPMYRGGHLEYRGSSARSQPATTW